MESLWLNGDKNTWILGDSGYPLEPWLITPYRVSDDQSKIAFNQVHSKARSIVERAICVLKGRWRILLEERKPRYLPVKLAKVVNVCAALHNICIFYNIDNDFEIQNEQTAGNFCPNVGVSGTYKQTAERIRNQIKENL